MSILFSLFYSCEKELYEEPIKNSINYKVNRKSFNELNKELTFSNAFKPIGNKLKEKKEGRSAIEEMYNFTIDSLLVKEVVSNNYTSFTLKIHRENSFENYFENLLIEIDSNNKKQISLIKYNIIPETKEIVSIQNSVIYTEKTIYVTECTPITVVIETSCPCEGHWPGETCGCDTQPSSISYNGWYCYDSSFDVQDGTGGAINGDNTGTSGGTWSTNPQYTESNTLSNNVNLGIHGNGNIVITAANNLAPSEKRRRNFQQQLITNNILCLSSLIVQAPNFEQSIYEYLESSIIDENSGLQLEPSTYSPAAIAFVNTVIQKACNNPGVYKTIKPFLIEKKINDDALDDCTKGILNQLKGLQQNDIAEIFAKFGPTDTVYTVEITPDATLDELDLGVTDYSSPIGEVIIPFEYTIKLNNPYLLVDSTELGIASTILHELIHAYFLSLADDYYEYGNSSLNSFPLLWGFYVNNIGGGSLMIQHNQMAESYVTILASALQEFQTGSPVPNGVEPLQIYKDLAWGGLEDTPPYNALSDVEKARIQAVNRAENTNLPQTVNGVTHYPLSSPCN